MRVRSESPAALFRNIATAILLASSMQSQPAAATSAAEYRRQADEAVRSHNYALAASAYRSEAAIYRWHGDNGAAEFEERKSEHWTTTLALFVEEHASTLPSLDTHARLEPVTGCYLGAYVMNDPQLREMSENRDPAGNALALGKLLGKPLATAYDYCTYGDPFPLEWARSLTRAHIAPHIAWEPNAGLDKVQNDAYLQQFAKDAAECGGPVFIRFASEMNGDWTNYHQDPKLYREKFRLVHDVVTRTAPNAAMIWCVNSIPEENIPDYYPGDDAVDWVGVNLYSVLHHDSNPARPAESEDPTVLVDYIYDHFSARKPIAICEYGASHREKLAPDVDRSDVAQARFAQLFAALPRRYPRVKLIDIFDLNCLIANVMPGRQLNDYSITDNKDLLRSVARLVSSPYFLSIVTERGAEGAAFDRPVPLASGVRLPLGAKISAVVRSYEDQPVVAYAVDGVETGRRTGPGDYEMALAPPQLKPGRHRLLVQVLDRQQHVLATKKLELLLTQEEARANPTPPLATKPAPKQEPENPPTSQIVAAAVLLLSLALALLIGLRLLMRIGRRRS